MTETSEKDPKQPLKLTRPGRLELRKTVEHSQVRQSFSHGRTKTVAVEVKKKRSFAGGAAPAPAPAPTEAAPAAPEPVAEQQQARPTTPAPQEERRGPTGRILTEGERAARARALRGAGSEDDAANRRAATEAARRARDDAQRLSEQEQQELVETDAKRAQAEEAKAAAQAAPTGRKDETRHAGDEARRRSEEDLRRRTTERLAARQGGVEAVPGVEEDEAPKRARPGAPPRRPVVAPRRVEPRRRTGKLTVVEALSAEDAIERTRSLAAQRRARERERQRLLEAENGGPLKVIREVVVPETITVQDLASRMAERGVDVIKSLMKMGVMATINQPIDADTAELIVAEFGHKLKRVAESDVEIGIGGEADDPETLKPRPPVVTIMGHVDHGKTSLLDALRHTDVAAHEAGGITQHIGAYQVTLASGRKITFIDTPGHEAFTAMRARGAKVTDIVVLVVAADDGVQPQTAEAIAHAKAAGVPMIVAVNKIDKPGVNPDRVRTELLQHEVVAESMGGDVQVVEVSATKGTNLDKLEEAILLQAEVLELKANADRPAQGIVIESRLERGRGSVATVLIQRGTLRQGDVIIAGGEWGRVRALSDDKGKTISEAGPSMPVEVLGLNGAPEAGDEFAVIENEARAREITEFRQRRQRNVRVGAGVRGTVEEMFSGLSIAARKTLPVVIKADVQGSVEAIAGALSKLSTDEVATTILHQGVGAITESDVVLAKASGGFVIGFNVRAVPQARELSKRDGVDIRYYSIIYNVVDDVKAYLSGMLSPTIRENLIGNAEVREVFEITKAGKVAGCRVTEGVIRRNAKFRLLRDNVVIHEGPLKSLKHFKEDVREVKEGLECGMAFENFQDVRQSDVIECYEVEQVARAL
ncbi:MAG: translation initiation factor IF-2 [Alphaproteobacteria bacterium]|nr:translation initiation factor IF-2 [Alphaproteobacteria bacterium]